MKKSPFLSIAIVAFGDDYIKLSLALIKSVAEFLCLGSHLQIIVFTDKPQEFVSPNSRITLTKVGIEKLEWPYASLQRFMLIDKYSSEFQGEFIIYLDADLLIVSEIDEEDALFNQKAFFVEHPGYHNRDFARNFKRRYIKSSWETNRESSAFVRPSRRRHYVYGAIFGGPSNVVIQMCKQLSYRIETDNAKGLFARSYDESHLNAWFSEQVKFSLLSPEYAFVSEYPWLDHIILTKIVAVSKVAEIVERKNDSETRFRNESKH